MIAASEDRLLEEFRNIVRYKPECSNCGKEFFRKELEENLKESGALEDVESGRELSYIQCPNCGKAQDFASR